MATRLILASGSDSAIVERDGALYLRRVGHADERLDTGELSTEEFVAECVATGNYQRVHASNGSTGIELSDAEGVLPGLRLVSHADHGGVYVLDSNGETATQEGATMEIVQVRFDGGFVPNTSKHCRTIGLTVVCGDGENGPVMATQGGHDGGRFQDGIESFYVADVHGLRHLDDNKSLPPLPFTNGFVLWVTFRRTEHWQPNNSSYAGWFDFSFMRKNTTIMQHFVYDSPLVRQMREIQQAQLQTG